MKITFYKKMLRLRIENKPLLLILLCMSEQQRYFTKHLLRIPILINPVRKLPLF